MVCKVCGSDRQKTFNGEVAIHFLASQGLDKPTVWVFPQILVCLNCGVAEFSVREAELSVLADESSRGAAG
jgi:hypothetical protein